MTIDKRMKYEMQGGSKPARNYLGTQKTVSGIPVKWKSGPDAPSTELAYITKAEKDLLLKKNLHGSLKNGPNTGPDGIMSLDSQGDYTRDRSRGAYSKGPAGSGGGNTQQDLRNRAMNEKHMREILTGQKKIGQTVPTGPKTRKYAVPEYVKVKQKDGTYKDKYIGSGYKSYGTPSFLGNLFSRGAPGYRGIKGMPGIFGKKPGFEARGTTGKGGTLGYYSDNENFGDTRGAMPLGILGLLSNLFSKKKPRDFSADNRKGLYEDRFKEDFNRNRKIPGLGESAWKGGMFNPETLWPTGAIGPEYGVEYDVNTEPYQLPPASEYEGMWNNKTGDSWEWMDNPVTDFIKSGGEKVYDWTHNPDNFELAKNIWPTYKGALEDAGVKQWGADLQEDVSKKGWGNTINDRLGIEQWGADLQGDVSDKGWADTITDRLTNIPYAGDAFQGVKNIGEKFAEWRNPTPEFTAEEQLAMGTLPDPFVGSGFPPTRTPYPGDSWGNTSDLSEIDNQVAGNYSQNAVAHQLFGGNLNTAFDDLSTSQQGQVMDAIGAYGTTSLGNLRTGTRLKKGGRVGYANGGLASLFTRRG